MIKKLAVSIVDYQIKRGVLQKEQKQTYIFGYQLLIGKILSVILMLIIAVMTGTLVEMLLFMFAFIILRQYAGGFHFKNAEICIFFSAIVCMIVTLALKSNIGWVPVFVTVIIEFITFIIIWKLAPIDSENKRLDDLEKRIYKNRSRVVLIIECLILVLSIKECWSILWTSVLMAHIVVAASLVIAYILNIFLHNG